MLPAYYLQGLTIKGKNVLKYVGDLKARFWFIFDFVSKILNPFPNLYNLEYQYIIALRSLTGFFLSMFSFT